MQLSPEEQERILKAVVPSECGTALIVRPDHPEIDTRIIRFLNHKFERDAKFELPGLIGVFIKSTGKQYDLWFDAATRPKFENFQIVHQQEYTDVMGAVPVLERLAAWWQNREPVAPVKERIPGKMTPRVISREVSRQRARDAYESN